MVCPDTPGWQADPKLLSKGAVFCRASPHDKLALLKVKTTHPPTHPFIHPPTLLIFLVVHPPTHPSTSH